MKMPPSPWTLEVVFRHLAALWQKDISISKTTISTHAPLFLKTQVVGLPPQTPRRVSLLQPRFHSMAPIAQGPGARSGMDHNGVSRCLLLAFLAVRSVASNGRIIGTTFLRRPDLDAFLRCTTRIAKSANIRCTHQRTSTPQIKVHHSDSMPASQISQASTRRLSEAALYVFSQRALRNVPLVHCQHHCQHHCQLHCLHHCLHHYLHHYLQLLFSFRKMPSGESLIVRDRICLCSKDDLCGG